jgi:hypothetical protein
VGPGPRGARVRAPANGPPRLRIRWSARQALQTCRPCQSTQSTAWVWRQWQTASPICLCTEEQAQGFLQAIPLVEQLTVKSGIILP